jgi:recombination protein RecA
MTTMGEGRELNCAKCDKNWTETGTGNFKYCPDCRAPKKKAAKKRGSTTKKTAPKKRGATTKKKAATTKRGKSKDTGLSRGRKAMAELASKGKKYKLTTDDEVPLDDDLLKQPLPHISTGAVIPDFALGGKINKHGIRPCPGLPKGKISNVYGWEGSGKTTLGLKASATTCKNGGSVLYVDYENEVVPTYAADLGVPIADPDRFLLLQPETMEEGIKKIALYAHAGVDLIIIDSVGMAIPEAAMGEDDKKTQLGLTASKWSKHLPKLKRICSRSGTHLMGISQLRASMGQGGPTVQGGNVWRFLPAIRLMLRVVERDKGKVYSPVTNKREEQVIGAKVKMTFDKCKISSSQNVDFFFYLRWGVGIDDFRSMVDILQAHRVIKLAGSWYTWTRTNGEEVRAQGVPKLREVIEADADLYAEMEAATIKALSTVEKGTIVEEADDDEPEDLDSLLTNLAKDGDEEEVDGSDALLDG